MSETIGFIGLGSMGGAIVKRLLDAGEQVVVFDRNTDLVSHCAGAGAVPGQSVQGVADQADIVITCVTDQKASISVANEAAQGKAVKIYADLSTIGCDAMREISDLMAAKGIHVVDAPISGGRKAIEEGSLSVMLAGEKNALDLFEPVASKFAGTITRMGNKAGQAQLTKLVNNGINFTALLVSCEAVSVGVKAGIRPSVLVDAISAGTGRNTAITDKIPRAILPGTFNLGGPLGGVVKDLDLFLSEARHAGLPPGVIAHNRKMWSEAIVDMDPDSDASNIVRHFEKLLNVEVRDSRGVSAESARDGAEKEIIGFIGLGNMGGAIVRRMLACGEKVVGFDINPDTMTQFESLGMTPATSVRDVADKAGLVIVCIPTGGNLEVTRDVVQGKAIEVYAEFSTMKPATMREVDDIVSAAGVALVDAPVSGGVAIAERGELSVMMAGQKFAMERLARGMATVASHTFEIGDAPGQAQFCKLVNNAIGFTVFMASCEALVVGVAGGIDPAVLLDAVNAGSGNNSWTTDKFGPHILSRTFDAGGKMPGGPKALDLYLDEATVFGMPAGMVQKARDYWAQIAEGFGPLEDFTNMIKYFEAYVGAELRSPVYEKAVRD